MTTGRVRRGRALLPGYQEATTARPAREYWTDTGIRRRTCFPRPYGEPVLPPPSDSESAAGGLGAVLSTDAAVDQWLIGNAVEGDVDAFEALVRRHHTRIYRIALRIAGDPQDAQDVTQDVTQDVLIQLWGSLAGFLGGSMFKYLAIPHGREPQPQPP